MAKPPSGGAPSEIDGRFVVQRCAAFLPSVIVFGIAVGVMAAAKGFSFAEAGIMSASVFAGASQVAALEAWTSPPALLALALIVAAVNARYFLVGTTLGPMFQDIHPLRWMLALFITTDVNWAMAMQLKAPERERFRFLLFSGYLIFGVWVTSTLIGFVFGGSIGDPQALGVDLMVIVFFAGLLPSMWHGGRQIASWGTAIVVALSVWWLVGGHYHIVAGAISGALVAAFYNDEPAPAVGDSAGHV